MTTFISAMYTMLTGGTWSNYGSTPHIIKEMAGSKREAINEGIRLTNMRGTVLTTFSGEEITSDLRGALEIYARNASDRDNIVEDVKSILAGGSYTFSIEALWTERIRNRYEGYFEIKLVV